MSQNASYDFIIVGGGASGCNLARRLASSRAAPKILLLEAGGPNDDIAIHIPGFRGRNAFNPQLNWQYQTTPQEYMNDRHITYDRGKGLGGSTTINFGTWSCPPKDEVDAIGEIVGDDIWGWKEFKRQLTNLESYHWASEAVDMHKYIDPDMSNHGHNGPIKVGFPPIIEKELAPVLDLFEPNGGLNKDIASGNPLGYGVSLKSDYNGYRTTAADLLANKPDNLTVLTGKHVARILFNGKVAIGVETTTKDRFTASKEVIISAGAVDSPKLLMLSGIGEKQQLQKHNIDCLVDLPGVGKNLRDHLVVHLIYDLKDSQSDRLVFFNDPEAQKAALQQWYVDRTGPLTVLTCGDGIGFVKSENVYRSEEFSRLPDEVKAHLQKPTVPSYEVLLNPFDRRHMMDPSKACNSTVFLIAMLNPQAQGAIELASPDPLEAPRINPNFLGHEYDRRVVIEGTREVLKITQSPAFAKGVKGVAQGPKSDSDADILDLWRETAHSFWHSMGSVKMGRPEDKEACLDTDLRVRGIDKLRVVDASVVPFLPCAHTQTIAYIVAAIAGDKIAQQYHLD